MTFHDSKDASPDTVSSPVTEQPSTPLSTPLANLSRRISSIPGVAIGTESLPPPTPPKPAPKTGLDRVAEMQALKGEDYNEITVEEEGSVDDYAQYCNTLLSDDAMLFISVKSTSAEFVPKVLQVVEEAKRIRHKAGLDDEADLHQYVLYDTEKKKVPKRINLNDDADQKAKYTPPSSLTVHLSKIDMPELQPKSTLKAQPTEKGKKKEDKKKDDKKGR
ncbi:hypothetical protein D9611_006397 [Ephemerocybe angulata]|uniref:Uncharacterized protein n=1 Tax=Ephemerocybe angulata TaxID=980116 RepID=A0A8H5C6Q8_9AGAR|nr:hypothetical protein D9611_006397 [Tulosesus angulatus]